MTVRVRFAPSPTGFLHVGGARTALLNWLFARHHGGTFVLRVEDTDTARERPEFRAEIFRALKWLGIEEDEGPNKGGAFGPYAQSERGAMYAQALASLVERDCVYPCFCSAETAGTAPNDAAPTARCACDSLSPAERASKSAAAAETAALRLRVDKTIPYEVHDLIRGKVVFPPGEVEDFIVAKAGGAPLYNFAAAVDDAAMEISHVIRGEEHLGNTPKQMLLYRALDLPVPQFAHLPIILNTERKKLSKRDGATAVSDYERGGFLPEALRNFLVLLGWSPGGDRELLTLEEMIADFSLARVQKSGAVFDVVKLTWMNGEYLKKTPLDTLVDATLALLAAREDAASLRLDRSHVAAVVAIFHERAKTLAEITEQRYFFTPELQLAWDPAAVAKRAGTPQAFAYLEAIQDRFASTADFSRANLEVVLRGLAEENSVKAGDYIGPLRVALTGTAVSPGIFEVCEVLGRDVVLGRIAAFLQAYATGVQA